MICLCRSQQVSIQLCWFNLPFRYSFNDTTFVHVAVFWLVGVADRDRHNEDQGTWPHCQRRMVASKPASHLPGSWYCRPAAGCHFQVISDIALVRFLRVDYIHYYKSVNIIDAVCNYASPSPKHTHPAEMQCKYSVANVSRKSQKIA